MTGLGHRVRLERHTTMMTKTDNLNGNKADDNDDADGGVADDDAGSDDDTCLSCRPADGAHQWGAAETQVL